MIRRDRIRRRARLLVGATALLLAVGLACSREETPAPGEAGGGAPIERPAAPAPVAPETGAKTPAAESAKSGSPESQEELAERGRRVYLANCIACHAPDPTQPGALGPEIAGSSRALIEARVLRAAYPPGYEPKRDTKIMIALPHLSNDIDALYAYLSQAAAK